MSDIIIQYRTERERIAESEYKARRQAAADPESSRSRGVAWDAPSGSARDDFFLKMGLSRWAGGRKLDDAWKDYVATAHTRLKTGNGQEDSSAHEDPFQLDVIVAAAGKQPKKHHRFLRRSCAYALDSSMVA